MSHTHIKKHNKISMNHKLYCTSECKFYETIKLLFS